jgi:hypothetical protein
MDSWKSRSGRVLRQKGRRLNGAFTLRRSMPLHCLLRRAILFSIYVAIFRQWLVSVCRPGREKGSWQFAEIETELARLFEKRGALGVRIEGQLAFTILAMRPRSLCGRALKRSPSDLMRQRVISGTEQAAGNQQRGSHAGRV